MIFSCQDADQEMARLSHKPVYTWLSTAIFALVLGACAHGQKTPEPAPVSSAAPEAVVKSTPAASKPLVVVHVAGSTDTTHGSAHTENSEPPTQSALNSEACERIDINMANEGALVSLPGIGPSKASAIVTFRDSNGRFVSVDSLTAVPGIGTVTLEKLRPFLLAGPDTAPPSLNIQSDESSKKAGPAEKININTGSTEQLMELRGVGPKTAARIIAYREMHGSFLTLEALTEVKGIGAKTLEKLKPHIEVNVDINQASAEEFEALGFKNATRIVERRKKRGGFKGVSKLAKVPGTDKKLVQKLRAILH